jgi:two-component system, OmpR family, alkaline phosphatase synthesis response regulator PhoP
MAIIMIIDDDPEVVRVLKAGMEADGYNTVVGYDGQQALVLARTHKPDLIIMDVQMPMTSGLKALTFLRQAPETKATPVLFLSGARSDTIYPVVDSDKRAVFVKKPIDLEQISALVRDLLSQHRSAA